MKQNAIFPPPEPARKRPRIFPVFLPFSGCPQRCVFCAQDAQTGKAPAPIRHFLQQAGDSLEYLAAATDRPAGAENRPGAAASDSGGSGLSGRPMELAFFGGTFTALPRADLEACLDFAARWKSRGLIGGLRCSTRPDALSPEILALLARAGFTCIELGVQSFSDSALVASRRGYDGETARRACDMVRAAGFELGIQLLPGMPGQDIESAREDVRLSIGLEPSCVRLYPCLVLEGTALAGLWRSGVYRPWGLGESLDFLALACRDFNRAGIAVIRMGLAEEPGLAALVLAGPRHPAMGGIARSRALFLYIEEQLEGLRQAGKLPRLPLEEGGAMLLHVPRGHQGEFWGHRGELAAAYAALGLGRERVRWWDEPFFSISFRHFSGAFSL